MFLLQLLLAWRYFKKHACVCSDGRLVHAYILVKKISVRFTGNIYGLQVFTVKLLKIVYVKHSSLIFCNKRVKSGTHNYIVNIAIEVGTSLTVFLKLG